VLTTSFSLTFRHGPAAAPALQVGVPHATARAAGGGGGAASAALCPAEDLRGPGVPHHPCVRAPSSPRAMFPTRIARVRNLDPATPLLYSTSLMGPFKLLLPSSPGLDLYRTYHTLATLFRW
jgi:hypothetical protein